MRLSLHKSIGLLIATLLRVDGVPLVVSYKKPRDVVDKANDAGVPPVKVKILDEALCSGCKMFVDEQLSPVYEALGATVIDLQVIPFGNAEYVPDKEDPSKMILECQHGKAECDANSYEQCVSLLLYPYPQRYLPFIHCLYDELPMGYSDDLFDRSIYADCARKSALDWKAIADCHDNELQSTALQQIAFALTPDYHTYVPWIEVNGEHVEIEEDDSLLKAVCKAYQASGGKHPACDDAVVHQERI